MHRSSPLRTANVCLVAALASALMACGGGGDSTESSSAPTSGGAGAGVDSSGAGTANAAPTIQGQPLTSVLVGQAYSFQPTASDADGDTLTFSVANQPSWVSFDAATGRLSGTPTAADVATATNIRITVSDGRATATLGPFSIAVAQAAAGSALLSWTPPDRNTDGSTLTDLAGYRVLYGLSATSLTQTISITNASLSSYLVENLTQGTWYFAVVAVNSLGIAGDPSGTISKTIT